MARSWLPKGPNLGFFVSDSQEAKQPLVLNDTCGSPGGMGKPCQEDVCKEPCLEGESVYSLVLLKTPQGYTVFLAVSRGVSGRWFQAISGSTARTSRHPWHLIFQKRTSCRARKAQHAPGRKTTCG